MSFEGKNLYGQYIDYSEKKNGPRASSAPYTGTIFYNICIYSRSQVSVYRTIGPLVSSPEPNSPELLGSQSELIPMLVWHGSPMHLNGENCYAFEWGKLLECHLKGKTILSQSMYQAF